MACIKNELCDFSVFSTTIDELAIALNMSCGAIYPKIYFLNMLNLFFKFSVFKAFRIKVFAFLAVLVTNVLMFCSIISKSSFLTFS